MNRVEEIEEIEEIDDRDEGLRIICLGITGNAEAKD